MRLLAALSVATASLLACPALPAFAGGDPPASCGTAEHSCTTADLNEPGCNDVTCCSSVCDIEPACCDTAWDNLCVALAVKFCEPCGIASGSCLSPNSDPGCGEPNCCTYVCGLEGFDYCCTVTWDADCVTVATEFCNGCEAPGAGGCFGEHDTYGCNNLNCCQTVCSADPVCCNTAWDDVCVQWASCFCPGCGNDASGDCCAAHATPFCNDATCCDDVCTIDDYCCETAWDTSCVAAAASICSLNNCFCGDPTAGACKNVHANPGCNDLECCADVCLFDDFCCVVTWDQACANAADALCSLNPFCGGAGKGSCFVRHNTPGCDEAGCCGAVCNVDPNCCTFSWDQECADLAFEVCNDCGDVTTGSCFSPHGSGSCSDATCCLEVCQIDTFCCDEQWDELCVTFAFSNCDDPIKSCGAQVGRSCFIPSSYLPGCEDATCCVDVCTALDAYCCEVRWDAVCAEEALGVCGQGTGCPKRGSCLQEHVNAGCNEPICCTAVCDIDPACCLLTWDSHCVTFARAVCFGQAICPGSDSCTSTHGTPGCEDPACCSVVCALDPVCCIEAWDSHCVTTALSRCRPQTSWNCPCLGSCFESHTNPGCNDESCCSGVCWIDVTCCTVEWDFDCAVVARSVCCGDIGCGKTGCGNWCAGSCFSTHEQPYCNDAACCDSVCTIDPFCCGTRWDGSCASIAEARCGAKCGNPNVGSCFTEKNNPSCSDEACCQAVCDVDPLCCNLSWDFTCVELAVGTKRRKALCEVPECGDFDTGDCCNPHELPACSDTNCCEAVCASDPFCCDSQWDETCAGAAREESACGCVSDCGDACAGSCCEAHEYPLCNDASCCDAVCAIDPFCCELNGGVWDSACAQIALTEAACDRVCPRPECGDKDAGDCCTPHFSPACNDTSCCEDVCQTDDYCCDIEWDNVCAATAVKLCDLCQGDEFFCGSPDAGSCFTQHKTPYCDLAGCCSVICIFDTTCCEIAWDAECAQSALKFCLQGANGGITDDVLRKTTHVRPTARPKPHAGMSKAKDKGIKTSTKAGSGSAK